MLSGGAVGRADDLINVYRFSSEIQRKDLLKPFVQLVNGP